MPIWRKLLWHPARSAASRTFWTAGATRPKETARMSTATRNSTRVNPRGWDVAMWHLRERMKEEWVPTHCAGTITILPPAAVTHNGRKQGGLGSVPAPGGFEEGHDLLHLLRVVEHPPCCPQA